MANFFEDELRKLFGDGKVIKSPTFVGRACLGDLGRDFRVKAEFVTAGKTRVYEALRLKIINRVGDGEIDRLTLRFMDVWGKRPVPGNPYLSDGVEPRIWTYNGKTEWYAWRPGAADRKLLLEQVEEYLDVYRERAPERALRADRPLTVYLCVPSRGDTNADAEFARQKSLEELRDGNIPLCPLLLLPSDASPDSPERADALRDIGARMMDACQEIRVCARKRTPEMEAEIQRAVSLGIPIRDSSENESRTASRKRTAAKSGRKKSPAR